MSRVGKRFATRLGSFFAPSLLCMLLLAFFCVPALLYVLLGELAQSALAYLVYGCSAYTLSVWVLGGVRVAKRGKLAVYNTALGHRYLTDLPFRGRLSLCSATAMSLCYAVFALCTAIVSRSLWFCALSLYYLLLAAARGVLLHSVYQKAARYLQELQAARLCGWLLLALTFAVSCVTAQIILDGKGYAYSGNMIFVMAFYAFYCVIVSIVNFVRFRTLKSPALSASKVLTLATALVSMLSLQTAMFAVFGEAYPHQRLMNALTGTAVCLLLFLMAIVLLVKGTRALKHKNIVPQTISQANLNRRLNPWNTKPFPTPTLPRSKRR